MNTRTIAFALALGAPILVNGCGQPPEDAPSGEVPGPTLSEEALQRVAFQIPGRDLRTTPPVAVSTELHPSSSGDGTARLEVRYGEALPPRLEFIDEGAVKVLRDDGQDPDLVAGDGVYSALVTAEASAAATKIDPRGIIAERTLLITDPAVVDDKDRTLDPCKAKATDSVDGKEWSFGFLVKQAAKGKVSASVFATNWLRDWSAPELSINNDLVRPLGAGLTKRKVGGEVLRQWRCASGIGACCGIMATDPDTNDIIPTTRRFMQCEKEAATKELSMAKAPFRLLAIVNRVDLRGNMFFDSKLGGGELRFVFSVLDLERKDTMGACAGFESIESERLALDPGQSPLPGTNTGQNTVILEYKVVRKDQTDVKAWAQKWYGGLNSQSPTSGTFRDNLQNITDIVTKAGATTLLRIRTNESPNGMQWQLREFEPTSSGPRAATIKRTPAKQFLTQSGAETSPEAVLLGKYIRDNQAAVNDQTHTVPLTVSRRPFLGAEATHDGNGVLNGWWRANFLATESQALKETRHLFSVNTCNGCHSQETGTTFAHVMPRLYKQRSFLSSFLSGKPEYPQTTGFFTVTDPLDLTTTRVFRTLDFRAGDMARLMNEPVTAAFAFKASESVH
jgi:hypothetical protein